MKKIIIAVATILACGVLIGCGSQSAGTTSSTAVQSQSTVASTSKELGSSSSEEMSSSTAYGTSTIQGNWDNYVLSEASINKVKELLNGKVYENKDTFDIEEYGFKEDEAKFKEHFYKGVRYAFYDKDADGTSVIVNTRSKVEVESITFDKSGFSIVLKYYN